MTLLSSVLQRLKYEKRGAGFASAELNILLAYFDAVAASAFRSAENKKTGLFWMSKKQQENRYVAVLTYGELENSIQKALELAGYELRRKSVFDAHYTYHFEKSVRH